MSYWRKCHLGRLRNYCFRESEDRRDKNKHFRAPNALFSSLLIFPIVLFDDSGF